MTSTEIDCPNCAGAGYIHPAPAGYSWLRCAACDGIGRTWAPGAPSYGCVETLADRNRGEILVLGNGDCGRLLWHSRAGHPTTWLGLIGDFGGVESHAPIAYPSCVGVAIVSVQRPVANTRYHRNSKSRDNDDPVQRHRGILQRP